MRRLVERHEIWKELDVSRRAIGCMAGTASTGDCALMNVDEIDCRALRRGAADR